MAVVLITGRPGAGKTLSAVKILIEEVLPTGRQVFADIDGLDYEGLGVARLVQGDEDPVQACQKWHAVPEGSVVFIDECQRVFPVRNPASKVPEWVSEFETHRHKGLDVYLITQGPRLIDRHIHDLIDRHIHLYRAFGLKRSTRYEWNGVNTSPDPTQDTDNAAKQNFVFPKKYFAAYKSASMHTAKARLPWKPIAMLAVTIPLCVFLLMHLFSRLTGPSDAVALAEAIERPERALTAELGPPALLGEPAPDVCRFKVQGVTFGRPLYVDQVTGKAFAPSLDIKRVWKGDALYLESPEDGNLWLIC